MTIDGHYGWEQDGPDPTILLQSTDMADNALTAIKAAAASVRRWVFTTTYGRVRIAPSHPVASVPRWWISDDPDDPAINVTTSTLAGLTHAQPTFHGVPRIVQDESSLITVARYARKGGTARQAVSTSIEGIGKVVRERTDLVCQTDDDAQALANADVSVYGKQFVGGAPTIATVQLRPMVDEGSLAFVMGAELLDRVRFQWSDRVGFDGWVIGIDHDIQPLSEWTTTVTIAEVP